LNLTANIYYHFLTRRKMKKTLIAGVLVASLSVLGVNSAFAATPDSAKKAAAEAARAAQMAEKKAAAEAAKAAKMAEKKAAAEAAKAAKPAPAPKPAKPAPAPAPTK
jgi:colicin import membrane protein